MSFRDRLLCSLLLSGVLGACADGGSEEGVVRIDTLSNGALEVFNSAAGAWGTEAGWTLVEELRIGSVSGEGPDLFGRVADLQVDPAGRIFVLDSDADEVRVFDADGSHVRTIGGPGEGPGEFQSPSRIGLSPTGELWVVDMGKRSFAVFDSIGTHLRNVPRFGVGNVSPWPGEFLQDGTVVDVEWSFGSPRLYHRFSPEGDLIESIRLPVVEPDEYTLTTDVSRTSADVPYSAQRIWRIDPGGFGWLAVSDEYRVAKVAFAGDTLAVTRREFERAPVLAAERDSALVGLEWFRQQGGETDPSRVPAQKSAIAHLYPDAVGNLWVVPILPTPIGEPWDQLRRFNLTASNFDIFNPEGHYLGRVVSPVEILTTPAPIITDGEMYAIATDDLDVPYVLRLRIERN